MQNFWASNPIKYLPENYLLSFSPLIKDQHSSLGFEMHGDLFILKGGIQYKEANNSEKVGLLKQYPEYSSWWLISLVASHTWFPEASLNRPAPGSSRSLFVGNGCQDWFSVMALLWQRPSTFSQNLTTIISHGFRQICKGCSQHFTVSPRYCLWLLTISVSVFLLIHL